MKQVKARQPTVSAGQIAMFILLFTIGSAPMLQLGIPAAQDSWLALSAAAAVGIGVLWMYRTLQKRAPESDLALLFKLHFGKLIGGALGVALGLAFAYESVRNVRDFGELMSRTLLEETPIWPVILLMVGMSCYTVYKGVAGFFRVTQILVPALIVSYALVLVLLLASGLADPARLQPVLENGPAPVLRTAFPDLLSPFSGTVILLMFWKYASASPKAGTAAYGGYIGAAIVLILINAIVMMVLGPGLAALATLPTLEAAEQIPLASGIDVLVTVLLYIGLYVKINRLFLWGCAGSAIGLRPALPDRGVGGRSAHLCG